MKKILIATVVLAFSANQALAVSQAVKIACRDDYFAHCSMHAVGSPGLRQCMTEVGPRLSSQCLGALAASGEIKKSKVAYKKAHKGKVQVAKAQEPKVRVSKTSASKKDDAKIRVANRDSVRDRRSKERYTTKNDAKTKYATKHEPSKRASNRRSVRKQYAKRYLARS